MTSDLKLLRVNDAALSLFRAIHGFTAAGALSVQLVDVENTLSGIQHACEAITALETAKIKLELAYEAIAGGPAPFAPSRARSSSGNGAAEPTSDPAPESTPPLPLPLPPAKAAHGSKPRRTRWSARTLIAPTPEKAVFQSGVVRLARVHAALTEALTKNNAGCVERRFADAIAYLVLESEDNAKFSALYEIQKGARAAAVVSHLLDRCWRYATPEEAKKAIILKVKRGVKPSTWQFVKAYRGPGTWTTRGPPEALAP